MARDLKLTAVLIDKVSSGLAKAGQDWKRVVEEPAKAAAKTAKDAGEKAAKEETARLSKSEKEYKTWWSNRLKEDEKSFKYQLNLVKQSSALQERNEAQRARDSMRASHRSLNEATSAAAAAAKINRQAMIAEAALVADRFDRRASIERVRYAEALRLLKGNNDAIEAETRKHNAIISRINMDKASFPTTPFQSLLSQLSRVTGQMGVQLPAAVNTASASMSGASGISGKMAIGFAAAGAAALALGAGMKYAYGEARESIDADKRLDLVLRSTGRSVEFTTQELSKLANEYQRTTDYSDEAVKSAQTILLRYDAIGKDVFPKALKAAADLGAETGDLAGAAFNLGNALQMPEEAGRKLTAMGIKLTDAEKKMLEQFAETGETMKAQEFILAKVEKAYGGSAETMSHGTVKLSHQVSELAEIIGNPLVKAINAAAEATLNLINSQDSDAAEQYYQTVYSGMIALNGQTIKVNQSLIDQKNLIAQAKREEDQKNAGPNADQLAALNRMIEQEKKAKEEKIKSSEKTKDAAIEAANYRDEVEKNELDRMQKVDNFKKQRAEQVKADKQRNLIEEITQERAIKEEARRKDEEQAKVASTEKVKTEVTAAVGDPLAQLKIQQREELIAVKGNEAAITAIKARHEMERRSMIMETSRMTVGGIAGNLRNIAGQYKSFSGVAKKAAQVQNAMDTYAGATAAYKQAMGLPPPFGLIMAPIAAAAAVAGGLANASRINSQGFESGGWTGNGGRSEVAGVVHGGEMVWSQSDVRRVGGRQAAENIRQGNYNTTVSAPISIVIQGNADERTAMIIGKSVEQELRDHAWRTEQVKYRGITA